MRDSRDPQQLGETIFLEMRSAKVGILLAHDRVEAGLSVRSLAGPKPASQALVRKDFRSSSDSPPAAKSPSEEGNRAA